MSKIKTFESGDLRSKWNKVDRKWFFVLKDVFVILTYGRDPNEYLKYLRRQNVNFIREWKKHVKTLLMPTTSGVQPMNCADLEGIFQIIQFISSPYIEPFKRWLSQYERILTKQRKVNRGKLR